MSVCFVEKLPIEQAPDLNVVFVRERPEGMKNGFRLDDRACEGGAKTLYVCPKAMGAYFIFHIGQTPIIFWRLLNTIFHPILRFAKSRGFTAPAFSDRNIRDCLSEAEDDLSRYHITRQLKEAHRKYPMDVIYLVCAMDDEPVKDPYRFEALSPDRIAERPMLSITEPIRQSRIGRSLGESFKWETEAPFGIIIDRMIEERKTTVGSFIQKANISRQTLANMRKSDFVPKKYTALACAVGLELSYEDAEKLLKYAGYSFSPSIKGDVIVAFYLKKRFYDIDYINLVLFEQGQHVLGNRGRE